MSTYRFKWRGCLTVVQNANIQMCLGFYGTHTHFRHCLSLPGRRKKVMLKYTNATPSLGKQFQLHPPCKVSLMPIIRYRSVFG